MSKALDVSESGYYRYLGNKDKPSKDKVLSVAINELIEENPFNDNYGVPRVQMALEQRGSCVKMAGCIQKSAVLMV